MVTYDKLMMQSALDKQRHKTELTQITLTPAVKTMNLLTGGKKENKSREGNWGHP